MIVAIIKTWPAFMEREKVLRVFHADFPAFYFTLGRGKPQRAPARLYFTHRGEILGSFKVLHLMQNDGSLPKLKRLDGEASDWQIKPDHWVAICSRFARLKAPLYFEPFRGWRYFSLHDYARRWQSRVPL